MAAFLLGHLLEDLRGIRIAFGEVFGESHVDAAVFLFGRDRDGQHLALGEISEILHGTAPFPGSWIIASWSLASLLLAGIAAAAGSPRRTAPAAPSGRHRRRDGSRSCWCRPSSAS